MGRETLISWCDATWNPWQGCHKVSDGCKHCYMYRQKRRWKQEPSVVKRSADKTFRAPLSRSWESGSFVFVCSWSDFFHEDADEFRDDAWQIIAARPDLLFLIPTKRVEQIPARLPATWGAGWRNVAVGVTAEHQDAANHRIPFLLQQVPAAMRFVSIEPILGPVQLTELPSFYDGARRPLLRHDALRGGHRCGPGGFWGPTDQLDPPPSLDWVIVGCESMGAGRLGRPAEPDWFRALRDECVATKTPFFFKQAATGGKVDTEPQLDGRLWQQRPAWEPGLGGIDVDGG